VSASIRDLDKSKQSLVRMFLRFLASGGVRATITSTRRSPAVQKALWDCYRKTGCSNCRRGPGCFPAAPPGRSTHATGIAFDLRLDPPVYEAAGRAWEAAGFTWGGRFDDPIHFDFRPL